MVLDARLFFTFSFLLSFLWFTIMSHSRIVEQKERALVWPLFKYFNNGMWELDDVSVNLSNDVFYQLMSLSFPFQLLCLLFSFIWCDQLFKLNWSNSRVLNSRGEFWDITTTSQLCKNRLTAKTHLLSLLLPNCDMWQKKVAELIRKKCIIVPLTELREWS